MSRMNQAHICSSGTCFQHWYTDDELREMQLAMWRMRLSVVPPTPHANVTRDPDEHEGTRQATARG